MVQAQEYIDQNYPKPQRKEITKLNLNQKNLTGTLDLSDFPNLEKLSCGNNYLTALNLVNCLKLKEIYCSNNQLTSIDFLNQLPHPEKLE